MCLCVRWVVARAYAHPHTHTLTHTHTYTDITRTSSWWLLCTCPRAIGMGSPKSEREFGVKKDLFFLNPKNINKIVYFLIFKPMSKEARPFDKRVSISGGGVGCDVVGWGDVGWLSRQYHNKT